MSVCQVHAQLFCRSKMCGRTACTLAPDEVSRACSYRSRGGQRREPRWREGDADKYRPSYNKSPQSMSPVLLSHRHFDKVVMSLSCPLSRGKGRHIGRETGVHSKRHSWKTSEKTYNDLMQYSLGTTPKRRAIIINKILLHIILFVCLY